MKNLLTTFLALAMIASLGYGQVRVSMDYDKETDFSKFKNYNFTEGALDLPVNDLNQRRLITAISNALSKKGLTKSDDPDVLVDVKVSAEKKQSATATTDWYGAGYRYRWGGGFTTTSINVNDYMEGTIFIDFIDSNSNKLVWQGRGVGTLSPNLKAAKREKRIDKAINKIFKRYPPAG